MIGLTLTYYLGLIDRSDVTGHVPDLFWMKPTVSSFVCYLVPFADIANISFLLQTLQIARNDWTFTHVDGNHVQFGAAIGCHSPHNKDAADFMIDLRGTRFSMDPEV